MKTTILLSAAAVAAVGMSGAVPVEWAVDVAGPDPAVSPTMHGVFFEDINYGGDGGLYAELVENPDFRSPARGRKFAKRRLDPVRIAPIG